MTASQTPRYTVEMRGDGYYAVRDTKTTLVSATRTNKDDALAAADHRNQLNALGISTGDTVTGTTTGSHPRRITVTVDREPWIVGTRGTVALSDGKSLELVELTYLTVHESVTDALSTDPEDHSIHVDGNHLNPTIEPGDTGTSCHICYRTYGQGEWRLLLPDARNRRDEQLHMCRDCVDAIAATREQFPTTGAPWVAYA